VDTAPEADCVTQTDEFLVRPPTPPYVPAKSGVDSTTQIEPGGRSATIGGSRNWLHHASRRLGQHLRRPARHSQQPLLLPSAAPAASCR
jgi:hypothetical protein